MQVTTGSFPPHYFITIVIPFKCKVFSQYSKNMLSLAAMHAINQQQNEAKQALYSLHSFAYLFFSSSTTIWQDRSVGSTSKLECLNGGCGHEWSLLWLHITNWLDASVGSEKILGRRSYLEKNQMEFSSILLQLLHIWLTIVHMWSW